MASSKTKKKSALFVCLGNICRSTMAEGILQHLVKQRGTQDEWLIDSAGTEGWHVGSSPDPRTMAVLQKNGIIGYRHCCRVLKKDDFNKFNFIFGMDHENIMDINSVKPKSSTATIELLGKYDPQNELIIEDPYYTVEHNKNAFSEVYDQCLRCCQAFLDSLENQK